MAQGTVLLPYDVGAYGKPTACILNGITDLSVGSLGLVAGDQLNLVLYPRNKSATVGAPTTPQQIAAGSSILVTGKPQAQPSSSTLYFEATSFVESNSAGAGQTSGDWLYTGYLDLNKSELLALFTGANPSVAFMLVIDVIDVTGKPQRYLAPITIYAPYYTGTEGSPTPATPGYLNAAQIQAGVVNNWSFITDLNGGTATSLNAQATAGGAVTAGTQVALRGISTVNGGGYSIWEYSTSSVPAGAASVQPLDYNASTNPGKWIQVL